MSSALVLVTGASKGFGRSATRALCSALEQSGQFGSIDAFLYGRDEEGLGMTSKLLSGSKTTAHQSVVDMSDISVVEEAMRKSLEGCDMSKYSAVYLLNNAGSLGPLTFATEYSADVLREQFDVNVIAPMLVTKWFLNESKGCNKRVVVNVSSLAAVKAFPAWGIYCSGKAAREMYHTLVAEEDSAVRVLNYAPGPMDTQMQTQIRNSMPDIPLRQVFQDMHKEGKLVNPDDSAQKMARILVEDKYENGCHIDFYDE